jgi:hypothetical protein
MSLFYENKLTAHLPRWIMNFRFVSLAVTILLAILSLSLIAIIPVNSGQGWDGSVYYQLILDWINGKLGVAEDPYRLMRAGAFLPQIFYYIITGEPTTYLVNISRYVAVTLAALGGWFAVMACYRLGMLKEKRSALGALILLSCYLLTHAVFTMPAHYPLLSDHTALFISGFSLWLWSLEDRNPLFLKNISLGLMAAWGIFVMPLISVVPMVLLMFPVKRNSFNNTIWPSFLEKYNNLFVLTVSLISITIAVFFVCLLPLSLSNEILTARISGVAPALIEFKFYSAIISTVILSWALLLFFICGFHLIFKLYWVNFILALVAIIPALIIFYMTPTWTHGIGGPSLITNLSIQALQTPGTQIASLFSYFGPLGLLGAAALTLIILKPSLLKQLNATALIGAFFFLFLSIGTETRQFVAVLPILLFVCILVFKDNIAICFISMLFTIFLVFIGWPIADNIALGITTEDDFRDFRWQAYFGRMGPWMSPESILLFFSTIIIYLGTLFVIENFKKSRANS